MPELAGSSMAWSGSTISRYGRGPAWRSNRCMTCSGRSRSGCDDRSALCDWWPPAQIKLARCPHLVEPSDRGVVRSGLDQLRVLRNLLDDLLDRGNKGI